MKLTAIFARDVKPLKLVEINNLSDVVVIAGPNGVGKTRLIANLLQHLHNLFFNTTTPDQNFYITVKATNDAEKASWGKDTIATNNLQDRELLRYSLLEPRRKRSNITSSFLNFESNRTIQQVKQYPWDWNFDDPFREETTWNIGLSSMTIRFEDMIHSIFRKVRSRREEIALEYDRYEELVKKRASERAAGINSEEIDALEVVRIDPAKFSDPFQSFKDAFRQLLAPKELLNPDMRNQQLSFRTDDGQSLPISDLSSGEKEVVNIVFDFLLRGPSDCIVIFDEPELHLHPELSYRLLQTLRQTGSRNQFIFCTHSADIITASLDDTVVFIAPPRNVTFNQALIVKEDDETHQALKLLGQSIGVISLGRKIVLIEGEHGSLDKQTYGAILKNRFPKLVLVPSGGKALLKSFGTLNDRVLAKTIWGIEFFMLCDRDALPLSDSHEIEAATSRRLRSLRRYHLENYFLDEFTIAKVFEPMVSDDCWLRAPERIRTKLKDIAREQTSYAAALMTAAYFREKCGNVDIMPNGCNGKSADELVTMILNRSTEEKARIANFLDNSSEITEHVSTIMQAIETSLLEDSDVWKELIPGRIILKKFCREAPLTYDFFRTAYITAAELMPSNPFTELISIFRDFDQLALPYP